MEKYMNNIGRVISVNKNNWNVLFNNENVTATIRKKKNRDELPVVGDYVIINKDKYDNYTIEEIVNRKNTLKKLSIDRTTEKYKNGKEQILASNVDIVFIVTSLNNDFNIARLERLVLLGNKANSKIAFILTKSDLCSIKDRENYRKIIEERFNYPVFIISSYNKEGIDDLKSVWKENETAVFIGSSGVGKSTLINTLLDNSEIRTNDIRHKDDKGKHTTTSRNLYILKDSRIVIDEPGIRSVASNDMNSDLNVVFSKIIELSKECKYTTCTHENIKVCRILQAIENGEISQEEFNRYKKLQSKEYRKNSNFLRKN
jgi:ribosome biogenesis GTPase